ncbi:hypothetical protein [Pelagibacterium lentulum]|uniref:GST C-terminal domain-containing protein n=1 Tax=Pelagibacterium lentulum TaxID=2029865 RepID=A0A916W3E2_9HYPH|nr:hypothetical protein [Pelagibacterium lentulum]GGA62682.1 hypothetical protein GCM10011499_36270 [Pelagibacterium lentulum]
MFGEHFTGADAMLYVISRWCEMVWLNYSSGLNAFIENVERRRCVRCALADEGLEPLRVIK